MDRTTEQCILSQNKKVKNLFQNNSVNMMDWPAQSPDLNPLQNLWGIIKAQIKKDKPEKLNDYYMEQYYQRSLFETH